MKREMAKILFQLFVSVVAFAFGVALLLGAVWWLVKLGIAEGLATDSQHWFLAILICACILVGAVMGYLGRIRDEKDRARRG